MGRLKGDVLVAARGFRRNPAFAVIVVLILGLGIGTAVAMFSVFHAILVRRLPVVDQDRLVVLWPYRVPNAELSPPVSDFSQLKRESRTMHDVAGVVHWGNATYPVLYGDRPLTLSVADVTSNYFDVLGARPLLGRFLHPGDESPATGSPVAVVLSYNAWRSRFGGDPAIVGRRLVEPSYNTQVVIVGVAPAGLDYPAGTDCWGPISSASQNRVFAIARLASGATIAAARAEFFSIINQAEPTWKLSGASAETFGHAILGDATPALVALAVAAALLLLIACVNVGNLFLVRAGSRRRELAVRRALGASYADLVRQLVVESVMVAVAGGVLGAAAAKALVAALIALAPPQLPRLEDVQLHANLLVTTITVAGLAVVIFGVLPALSAAWVSIGSTLRSDARAGESRGRQRLRDILVASQMAIALVMLAFAGLLVTSLMRMEHVKLGYDPDRLWLASIAYNMKRYDSAPKLLAVSDELDRRLAAAPGVVAATRIFTRPLGGAGINVGIFETEGETAEQLAGSPAIPWEASDAHFFRTFDIPLVRGRSFAETDGPGAPVVIVSESVARRLWPGRDPIGKRLRFSPSVGTKQAVPNGFWDWRTVVGVAADTRLREFRESSPMVYVSWYQYPGATEFYLARSRNDGALASTIREVVRSVDPTLTLYQVRSMDAMLSVPLAQPRLNALVLVGFGASALLLAAVGLGGVMAATVRERTREIGIRVALGASPSVVRGTVLRHAVSIAAVGCVAGLGVALISTRLLRSILFEVSPADPSTFVGASAVLLLVAAVAAYVPARRATKIDPMEALRSD